MEISIKKNNKNVEEFNYLLNSVEWDTYDENVVKTALENTFFSVSVYDKGNIIGYGRLLGDTACYMFLQDVIVVPEYQFKKIGTLIVNELLKEVEELKKESPRLRVYLGASKDKEPFYEKLGFIRRSDASLGEGMVLREENTTIY